MKIRYKFGVWMLCLMFPALVWAENAKSICTSFTQQGRQVTFTWRTVPRCNCNFAVLPW